jgi:hypothetical protein
MIKNRLDKLVELLSELDQEFSNSLDDMEYSRVKSVIKSLQKEAATKEMYNK